MAFAPFEDGVVEFGTTALSPVQWDAMPQVVVVVAAGRHAAGSSRVVAAVVAAAAVAVVGIAVEWLGVHVRPSPPHQVPTLPKEVMRRALEELGALYY